MEPSLWELFESVELEPFCEPVDDKASAKIETGEVAEVETEIRGPSTWAKWMREGFREVRAARGEVLRPLNVASVCSGMNTHSLAMQEY